MTSLLTSDDLHYFSEGTHGSLSSVLGSHPGTAGGVAGTTFSVWAPNAESVSVIGDWNGWDSSSAPLAPVAASGIWEGFVAGAGHGARYKYLIVSHNGGYRVEKADPLALCAEEPPLTASVVWQLDYAWSDDAWMATRGERNALHAPMSVYEVHLGSWRRSPDDPRKVLGYRDLAPQLVEHVTRLGFTHVELLPVMEHPFYGSWGYQTTGYFAPTRRYGDPEDFMWLVDQLHQAGIGVILDWVPSHFPNDEHGLAYFDGTHLYEHSDPRQGFHPDWKSAIFNYGRDEVRSFLTSSASHWLDAYHADGIRVDAVASMLYLDYSRREGEWIPNAYGGRENSDAIEFLQRLNAHVYGTHPDVQMIAEESTSWPMVSRPTDMGGLGFGFKWDMGWMHDTLEYFKNDPIHRRHHQGELTFRALYAFTENFMLPLSHDEVVHGKGSLYSIMPGDQWQKFANLRLLYGYMYACSGKKLLFMGDEFGQRAEWSHEASLDWHELDHPFNAGLQQFVSDLNRTYRSEPALHDLDVEASGFEWVDAADSESSVLSFIRRGANGDAVLCVFNFTPVPRTSYRIGVPREGTWRELVNSDAVHYGGSGQGNLGAVEALPVPMHGRRSSVLLTLPPLSVVLLRHEGPSSSS
jgi:1,4-alpha-glucan branching enzyme